MKIYDVVNFERYPEWDVVITDFGTDYNGVEFVQGLAFNKTGVFEMGVTLRLPAAYEIIGYIYIPNSGFKLSLEKIY